MNAGRTGALEESHDDVDLDELVQRFQHRVGFFTYKVSRQFMLDASSTDDLMSAGYWGLFRALRKRRPDAHERELSAYVSRRIHGAILDAARGHIGRLDHGELPASSATRRSGEDGDWEGEVRASAWSDLSLQHDPEEQTHRAWRISAIGEALAQLDEGERRLIMAYMQGDSMSEIAREAGLSLGTLQTRFNRASRRVRAQSPELRRVLLDLEVR